MEFRILGPLEVSVGDSVLLLGGPKQRALLAHLILRANRVVPADVLIDELWGEEPPETARATLQTYVYRLRKLLGDERIEGRSGGYVLLARPEDIDASRFEDMVKEAKVSISTDPVGAAVNLAKALDLWRGPALADLAEEASLRGEIVRLEELRLAATEHRISVELAMGRHTTVISELELLTSRHPMRERLWAHLMLALYRRGRHGEALGAYERAREVLASELGADPSPELQRLHGRILNHDPELAGEVTPRPAARPSRTDLEPGSEFAGYRIERILGRGGMSVVYLAEHTGLQRRVALKVLAPQLADDARFRERFVRESRLAASVDHPNVIPIYEAGESGEELFIAMRYVQGRDLRSVLSEDWPLESSRAAAIVRQVAAALDAAHEQGLVHRDVKPANVLLARPTGSESAEHVYLSDFGFTKRLASGSGLTGTGQFVGTLDYAAPEQFKGGSADGRTDVYSLGCVLFECLAGRPPFRAENDAALMYAHLQQEPPSLANERPDLPAEIAAVVAKAMAKVPAYRQQTAGELAREASRALGDEIAGPREPWRPRRKPVALAAVAFVILLGIAVAVVVATRPEADMQATPPTGSTETPQPEGVQPPYGVAEVDPETGNILSGGRVVLDTSRQFGSGVRPEIAFGGGSIWVIDNQKLTRFDRSTLRIQQEELLHPTEFASWKPVVDIGFGAALLAEGRGLSDGAIARLEPDGRLESKTYAETGLVSDLEIGAGAVWGTFGLGTLLRIDENTLREEQRYQVGGSPQAVGVDETSVWVGIGVADTLIRIDPETGKRSRPIQMSGAVDGIAALGGVAWVLDRGVGTVTPVGSTVGAGQPIPVGEEATDIEAGLGAIWVSDERGLLYRVDPATREASTIEVGYPVEALTFDEDRGVIWVVLIECSVVAAPDPFSGC